MSLEKEHTDAELTMFVEMRDSHVARAQSVARRARLGRQRGASPGRALEGPIWRSNGSYWHV